MKLVNADQFDQEKKEGSVAYEAPAVIYETLITTRAGSPLSPGAGIDSGVDPADLFGE